MRPLRLHLERAARLLPNLLIFVVVAESRRLRFLPEVASLHQIHQVDECRRRHHQCLAFSAAAGESRCLQSLPEAVKRLRQVLPADECQRPHPQSLAFFAVVAAVVAVAQSEAARHPVLRLPGVASAAAQTSRWWTQVNHRHHRHHRHRSLAATSIGSPGWTSARVHV